MNEQLTKSALKTVFQKQVLELKQANVKLQNEIHELEQYGRRSFLRIDGIPDVSNESSEDVFNDIADIFVIAGIEDVLQHIDRAHRIGKSYHQKIEKKCKSIIVKFVSFRHRTKVYKKRKNLNDGVTVHPTNIHLQKTSSKRLDQGLYIRLGHVFKTSCTSSRRPAKTSSKHLQDVLKTFLRSTAKTKLPTEGFAWVTLLRNLWSVYKICNSDKGLSSFSFSLYCTF